MQNVPILAILQKKKFFFEVEKFPPKWKNFHFAYLGSNLANAKVQNPKTKFRQSGNFSTKSGKISTSAECSNSCDFGIKNFFSGNFMKWKIFHKSGQISTSSIWDAIWLTRRSRSRKKNFTKVENFPPKVENFPPLQNVPIHSILEKKKIIFGGGKFSTKVEKIPLSLFGMKLGILVCPDEE